MKIETKKSILIAGLFLLCFILTNVLISTSMFIFGISIQKSYVWISLIITVLLSLLLMKKTDLLNKKWYLYVSIGIVFPILCIMSSFHINAKILDLSYDGNSYHKAMIGYLADGWNPVYEELIEFVQKDEKMKLKNIDSIEGGADLWSDHYAKAAHIYQANVYAFTGKIEAGKSINFLSIGALFLILFSLSSIYLKKVIFPVILALCSVSYSVVSAQIFTAYIDLLVYLYLLLLILSFFLIEYKKDHMRLYGFILYVLSLLMMINIKFTSFAYAGVFCLGYYICYIVRLLKNKKEKKFFITFSVVSTICVIVGVFVIGLSTYVKNMVDHKHPFYPLFGSEKVDIITANQPRYFQNKTPIEKYFISMFSKMDNIFEASGLEAEYKIPFTIHESEKIHLVTTDARMSGSGLWFSGIFIFTVLILLWGLLKLYHDNKNLFWMMIIPLGITVILIFTLSEGWWARYLPQTYFLTLGALFILYLFRNKWLNCLLLIFMFIILNNNFMTAKAVIENQYTHMKIYNQDLDVIRSNLPSETETLKLLPRQFIGSLFVVRDRFGTFDIITDQMDVTEFQCSFNTYTCWKKVKNEEVFSVN